jgi:hypothetical protein
LVPYALRVIFENGLGPVYSMTVPIKRIPWNKGVVTGCRATIKGYLVHDYLDALILEVQEKFEGGGLEAPDDHKIVADLYRAIEGVAHKFLPEESPYTTIAVKITNSDGRHWLGKIEVNRKAWSPEFDDATDYAIAQYFRRAEGITGGTFSQFANKLQKMFAGAGCKPPDKLSIKKQFLSQLQKDMMTKWARFETPDTGVIVSIWRNWHE